MELLKPNQIQIWQIPLRTNLKMLPEWLSELSAFERMRYERLQMPIAKSHYLQAHRALQHILAFLSNTQVPVEFEVAKLAMEVGPTCYVDTCITPLNYDKLIDFTVNGVTKAFHLTFTWEISDADDRMTFSQPTSLSFDLIGGDKLSIDFLTPDALIVPAASLNDRVISSVKAKFSVTPAVPEPTTYAMLLAGLAVVGAVARRKSQA